MQEMDSNKAGWSSQERNDEDNNITKFYDKQKRKKLKKPEYSIKSQIENWVREDEFDIYGKYIASQLRMLELQTALKVQFEIQNLINEARGSASED